MREKFLLEKGNNLFIYDTNFPFVRALNVKTGDSREIENVHLIEKIKRTGEKIIAPTEKNRQNKPEMWYTSLWKED